MAAVGPEQQADNRDIGLSQLRSGLCTTAQAGLTRALNLVAHIGRIVANFKMIRVAARWVIARVQCHFSRGWQKRTTKLVLKNESVEADWFLVGVVENAIAAALSSGPDQTPIRLRNETRHNVVDCWHVRSALTLQDRGVKINALPDSLITRFAVAVSVVWPVRMAL